MTERSSKNAKEQEAPVGEAGESQVTPGGVDPSSLSYSVTLRVEAGRTDALLIELSHLVASVGAQVSALDLVEVTERGVVVDITVGAADEEKVAAVVEVIEQHGHRVRYSSDRVFLSHLGGVITVHPKDAIRTRDDLSLCYTPGVGRIASAIARDADVAWNLTIKSNAVAVVTDGSAVLGLGSLGPLAALPVMEGKAAIFKSFGNVDAYPICLDVHDSDELVSVVKAIAPGFGGINLEDIAAPVCFEVERRLEDALDIPVFHDDQHGTAVVVLAGLINACRATNRKMEDARVVVVGIGAAGNAICNVLLDAGVHDITPIDLEGPLDPARPLPAHHAALAARTGPVRYGSLGEALEGADVFVGVSRRGAVTPAQIARMAKAPIIFALANPVPELFPSEVPDDAIIATGRSDLPNQVNNALCFPGFFRGALDARARRVTTEMKQAAAMALAKTVSEKEQDIGIVIPSLFNAEVHRSVALAVRSAARNDGQVRQLGLSATTRTRSRQSR